MANIASIDWANKRFYLHIDTVTLGFDAWEAYAEVRAIIQANSGSEQNYKLFIHRQGKIQKRPGFFTPRYMTFDSGWRGIPYDIDHILSLPVEMVSDDFLTDRDVFDRSTVLSNVDIDPTYQQVEIIEVTTGGASQLNDTEKSYLADIPTISANIAAQTPDLEFIRKKNQNEYLTDPNTGEHILYDDLGNPEYKGNAFEDVGETQLYRGQGIERRKRLEKI